MDRESGATVTKPCYVMNLFNHLLFLLEKKKKSAIITYFLILFPTMPVKI